MASAEELCVERLGDGPLDRAWAAARASGVTRLADVTRLDRLGVPVFQAIRPQSRALTVHQGKGLDAEGARIGALMESLESAYAEEFDGPRYTTSFAQLAPDARAAMLSDFARDRDAPVGDEEQISWSDARRLIDGRPMAVPFDCVSLDFTGTWDRRLDHTSCGLGARFDLEGARLKALFEVVERDAEAEWRALADPFRAVSTIDGSTIAYPWFLDIDERLRRAGAGLRLYAVGSVTGAPVIRAKVSEPGVRRRGRISTGGWGCAPTWEAALLAAVLEAVQARLTAISGVRDDILYYEPGQRPWSEDASPLPPGMTARSWAQVTAQAAEATTVAEIVERLAEAGYPDTAAVTLSPPDSGVCVVKAFAPGLGANQRRRRQPARHR